MELLFAMLHLIIVLTIYFIPSYLASKKNKYNKKLIFTINFLLGWSFFGWLGALYLALKNYRRDKLSVGGKGIRISK